MQLLSAHRRTTLQRILRVFGEAELTGSVVSAQEAAVRIGMSENTGPGMRRELVALGWLRIDRQGYGCYPAVTAVTDTGWGELGGRPAADPKVKPRRCLCCEKTFTSDGPGNRICPTCHRLPAFRHGDDAGYRVAL